MNMLELWRFGARFIGGNKTESYAIGARAAAAFANLIGGILAVALLDAERVGVFLVLVNLASFGTLADLGLNYSLLLTLPGAAKSDSGKIAVAGFMVGIPTAILVGGFLFGVGSWFFAAGGVEAAQWFWAWTTFCCLGVAQQILLIGMTFLEGSGQRAVAWRAHFFTEAGAAVAFIVLIGLKHELWAPAAAMGFRVLLFSYALSSHDLGLPRRIKRSATLALWHENLFPMQWKTFVNNFVGLVVSRLLTPILLVTQGPVFAGQVGFVLAIAATISGITSAWPVSQTPVYSTLLNQKHIDELLAQFRRMRLLSTSLAAGIAAAGVLALEIFRVALPSISVKLPPLAILLPILMTPPFAHLCICFAVFIRIRRSDPVMLPNLLLAFPTVAGAWFAASYSIAWFTEFFLLSTMAYCCMYGIYWKKALRAITMEQAKGSLGL